MTIKCYASSQNTLPETYYIILLSLLPTSCSILSTHNDWGLENSSKSLLSLGLNAEGNYHAQS